MSAAAAIAARLKLKKRSAPEPEPAPAPTPPAAPPAAPPAPAGFAEGATVEGNFKGFGDWDEALIVGKNADGTYVLEYVDEGLIEEGVPASRIRMPGEASGEEAGDGEAAALTFSEGESVLGNFKDLGDWDEALVVGKMADGTYVLEYVDEGLIEEGVPASRIAKAGGADAEASAGISLAADEVEAEAEEEQRPSRAEVPAQPEESEEEEESESDDEDPLASEEDFAACASWRGPKPGFCFKKGELGVGYYRDVPLHEAAEAEERARIVLTAAQLANWSVELLAMPPSVGKVDKFVSLFDLPALRVQSLRPSKGGSSPFLFDSLEDWFDKQLPMLSERYPTGAVEVTLRVFLAPQQSVRQGIQHVTFAVDWVRVMIGGDAADEAISGALLKKLGMASRARPAKMLLVLLYRAEKNKITHIWADVDREGLGAKKAATLDDVLLSDAFDTCLAIARKGGAVGSLDPLFHNYHQALTLGM